MTHVEFEYHFTKQAERFGIAKIIRQSGEEYAFQSFMLALSGIVARDQTSSVNEEELDKIAREEYYKGEELTAQWFEGFKAGYRKAMEE